MLSKQELVSLLLKEEFTSIYRNEERIDVIKEGIRCCIYDSYFQLSYNILNAPVMPLTIVSPRYPLNKGMAIIAYNEFKKYLISVNIHAQSNKTEDIAPQM